VSPSERTTSVRILSLHQWSEHLFSFTVERPQDFRFKAGQFARLGVPSTHPEASADGQVWRAYSMVSGPYDDTLAFYSIVVPQGAFTSVLSSLQVSDTLSLDRQAYGYLTCDRFPKGGDLWLLSSGTGIAPFMSMLSDPDTWSQFNRILLVHSVRFQQELAYRAEIESLSEHPLWGQEAHRLTYIPVVTRESTTFLSARIPELLRSGVLAERAACAIGPQRSKFMICGNPEMVSDCKETLKEQGFTTDRPSRPGQIATENYW
jgi:ferredoxin--NADP+ reductase